MSQVDLSKLPVPQLLEDLDFEALYLEDLASFRAHMGNRWTAKLESDPVIKLLEVGAYRKLLNRARVNDAAKALLLAYAKEGDLDQLAANVSLQRLVIRAANPNTIPPTELLLESDDALRERVQLRSCPIASRRCCTWLTVARSTKRYSTNADGAWSCGSTHGDDWASR
ncbi:hypothetical protein WR25_25735 [Diploscapter pachys]|uniref:Uncharacterized protein n=1 Tax=Diploscapter pachys TaxID=2018661 RepID=A0A2A2K3F7_9BILA|nr:hypothetical protein WR25_25735 [Diploscapter pachys]